MTSNERDIGHLLAVTQNLESLVRSLKEDVDELKGLVDQLKGGYRVLVILSGFVGAAVALAVKYLPLFLLK